MMKKVPFFFLGIFFSVFLSAQTRPDAVAEFQRGNYERAVSICLAEIRANRNNLEAHVVISWALVRLSRYGEAKRYALTGRDLNRYDARIIEILGEIAWFEGQNAEALAYFQEYVNLAPEGARIETVYYLTGEVYIRLGRFRHADIALSTAIHYVPDNAAWWARLAWARENAGDFLEAVTAYERALALNSQLTDARRGLERARQALGSR
ncbi:MAG: tetratricopeptide repeat protein [Spirochaetaceae bacterium]|jgi:tetratricopeptide (TPR) repeat protein|nr:tetratricopeptide repeat protein [Spirochaetaceae bacterium]